MYAKIPKKRIHVVLEQLDHSHNNPLKTKLQEWLEEEFAKW